MFRPRLLINSILVLAPALAGSLPGSSAANWPQWRGPQLDGTSSEADAPVSWNADTNIVWKLPLPARSGSTPVVWDDRIFLAVAEKEKEGELSLWCVDAGKGSVLWKRSLSAGNEFLRKHNLSSPSPVTDGKHVWAMTGTGIVKAFDFEGKNLWTRDIQSDYGKFGLMWGYASSPLLWNGGLFVQVLHGMKTDDPSYLLRLNPETGETVWRAERPTPAVMESPDAYSTPIAREHGDGAEIIVSGGDVVTAHDPETGKELWRARVLNPQNNPMHRTVTTPVVVGDMVVAFGKRGPVVGLRAGGSGDVTDSHVVWTLEKGTDVPTPTTDGKHLFMVNDRGVAWCIEAETGTVVWGPERLEAEGPYSASPVRAGEHVYATSEEGTTTVFEASKPFRVVARNELGEYTLSSLAVAGGRIYARTSEHLWAIGEISKE